MRICFLADASSIHTQRWVKYFVSKGHEVHLISFRSFGGNDIENVKLYVLRIFRPQIRAITYLMNFFPTMIQAKRLIRRINPDVLHAHFVIGYGRLGALSGFHPFILSAWGSDVLVAPRKSIVAGLEVKFALRKADFTLTTSEYLKGYLHREFDLPQHSVRAIPWGIDLGIFHRGYETEVRELRADLGIDDKSFVVLSPRHLRDHYRIEYIIRAMPYILAKYPRTVLVLLKGASQDSEYESKMDSLSTDLGVVGNTRVIRRELGPQEVAVLYNASGALVSIPRSDQFSSCIQEGMACGTIPVVGELEVYRQYLQEGLNALFVDAEEPQQIAARIIHCIERPELKDRFYEINRRITEEKQDWEKNAKEMERLYASLSAQKSKEDSRDHADTLI